MRAAPGASDYGDVKITIAESELFSVHAARAAAPGPADFGDDFLGRALARRA